MRAVRFERRFQRTKGLSRGTFSRHGFVDPSRIGFAPLLNDNRGHVLVTKLCTARSSPDVGYFPPYQRGAAFHLGPSGDVHHGSGGGPCGVPVRKQLCVKEESVVQWMEMQRRLGAVGCVSSLRGYCVAGVVGAAYHYATSGCVRFGFWACAPPSFAGEVAS